MKPRSQIDASDTALAGEPRKDQASTRPAGPRLLSLDSAILKTVPVALQAWLGETRLSVGELTALKAGSVIKLDLKLNDLVELRLNDSLVARGEIVAVDDNFGIRIVEIAHTA